MKKNKVDNCLFGVVMVLLLILFIFLLNDHINDMKEKSKTLKDSSLGMIDQRINALFSELNNFPRSIGDDLLFLTEISSLEEFLEDRSPESKTKLEKDFLAFLNGSYANYRLGYINREGKEELRVEFDGKASRVVQREKYDVFKEKDIFINAMKLSKGEAYISQIYLIEDKNMNKLPIMGASMPVYKNGFEGVIYIDLYIDYFLDDIRNFQREGEKMYLINKGGDYLANKNKSKEFAYISQAQGNFFEDYTEISKSYINNFTRRVETDKLIFSFKYITPVAWDSRIYGASEKWDNMTDEKYIWILVGISEKTIMNDTEANLKREFLLSVLFSSLIIMSIVILMFFIWRGNGKH